MMSRVPVRLLLVVLLALVAAPIPMMQGLAQETVQPDAASPTDGWETAPPASRGMDPALLAEADRRVRTELPLLSAMLVARGDALVFEQYYNGQSADDPIHVWSMTKSVTSLGVGIALAEGRLQSIDQTLGQLIPDRIPAGADPRVASITVENLLTMTSGFVWDSRTDFLHLDDAPDWAARTLSLPMNCNPGECYEYNSGNAHLVSVVLQAVTGETLADYLQPRLFDPLGIPRPTWRLSPQGETAGGFGLELTGRDAARIGYLALQQGVWDGQQIVPADWIAASTAVQSSGASVTSGANLGQAGYGYFWWVTEAAGYPAFFALGYGSQVIYVVPDLDLVAVGLVAEPNVDLQQAPRVIFEQLVVPAALAGPSTGIATAPTAAESPAAPALQPTAVPPTSQSAATPAPGFAATPTANGSSIALPGQRVAPAGLAARDDGTFFVGSGSSGAIYRGNLATGEVGVVFPATANRAAYGLALDEQGRLFVAGGQTGFVAVYDTATGDRMAELGNGLEPNTFLNDVAVAPSGDAYVTDSFNPILWRVPAAALPGAAPAGATPVPAAGAAGLERFLDLAGGGFEFGEGLNANGIVATPDGRYLLFVQSNTGALFRVEIASRELARVDLGGAVLSGGDGLLLAGAVLYVAGGGGITPVTLAEDLSSGIVGPEIVDPAFPAPTTLARSGRCLLVAGGAVAGQGTGSPTIAVAAVPMPAGAAATPAAAGSC